MILSQDLISVFVLILILVIYFFQLFQKVKLIYLFRSAYYHFANIFFRYNSDDLNVSKINYFHYFYLFFSILIPGVIVLNIGIFLIDKEINYSEWTTQQLKSFRLISYYIYSILLLRFLIIRYLVEIFISPKLKFIFFKNFIIDIITGLLILTNLIIFYLNTFFDLGYLKISSIVLIALHFIFQTKNYLSVALKFELKEFMYFILYLCGFKLAPWLWLYLILF